VFNQVSRIAVFPLVSVTTSFVAEEDAMSNGRDNDKIHQQNERNVSVSEMDELIPPEGDLLLQKSMDRWPLHILLDTSKFTCRG
jgi:hypothetical protein